MASVADQAKLDGDQAFKAGDYQKAVDLYTTAIAENAKNGTNPKHVLLSNRSACNAKLCKWDDALADAKACIIATPSFAKGHARKAAALEGKQDFAGAAQSYQKALDIEPYNDTFKQQLQRNQALAQGGAARGSASNSSASGSSSSVPFFGGGTNSAAKAKVHPVLDVIIILAQLFCIVNGVWFVFTMDAAQSRFLFLRSTLGAVVAYMLTAVGKHGMPNLTTFKTMYKAFRGTATQQETKGFLDFAQDENTHYIFFSHILVTCSPSLVLLMPLVISSAITGSHRAKRLCDASPLRVLSVALFDKVVARERQLATICANAEVMVLVLMVVELFTPRRNILFLILYFQLIKVRVLSNADSRAAWENFVRRVDGVFLHARSPSLVQAPYRRLRAFIAKQMQPPQAG